MSEHITAIVTPPSAPEAGGNTDDAAQAMTLAAIAYAPLSQIPTQLATDSPRHHYATGDLWRCVWKAENAANQAFIARRGTDGAYAVAIRGSDGNIRTSLIEFLLNWVVEDLLAFQTLDFEPFISSKAKISLGLNIALDSLMTLEDGGVSMKDFLADNLPAGGTVWVTGHSLGGATASVVAPWLCHELGSSVTVRPLTFAGQTAGNPEFADYLTQTFGEGWRYFNSLDVVPMGFASLTAVADLYPGAPSAPAAIKGAVDWAAKELAKHGLSYQQPAGDGGRLAGYVTAYRGRFETDLFWFLQEIGDQHNHNMYLKLLGATQPVTGTPAAPPA